MPDFAHIPLMFQAQVAGRCQLHKIEKRDTLTQQGRTQQQAYDWVEEWDAGCDRTNIPQFASHIHSSRQFKIPWRMVTNSGQDAGIIRPVIGERGWAYFPGSSMKGAFLRACNSSDLIDSERVKIYCAREDKAGVLHPGTLRFHGGYPTTDDWLNSSLIDIVHPQENWQLNGSRKSNETAKIQISLYNPTFVFGISSREYLNANEWEEIWQIWEYALGQGIGSSVSAGYGQIRAHGKHTLRTIRLSGQGLASQRINGTGEFRPNLFKAALRGHTRRLLGGITEDSLAEELTQKLWGGIGKNGATVGFLGVAFASPDLAMDTYLYRGSEMPVFETGNATLDILAMQNNLSAQQRKHLRIFIIQLIQFSMLLGGFGRSWRRVDHRLFVPTHGAGNDPRPIAAMIGCHWMFTQNSEKYYIPISLLEDVETFLNELQRNLQIFLDRFFGKPIIGPSTYVREAWKQGNVEVWGRIIKHRKSDAIAWFHGPYSGDRSIKASELTGWSSRNDRDPKTQIGRIWHRMYPRYEKENGQMRNTHEHVELLTIFPNREGNTDEVEKTEQFLNFLDEESEFQKVW
jgi:CRISPR-associated protein Cmr6